MASSQGVLAQRQRSLGASHAGSGSRRQGTTNLSRDRRGAARSVRAPVLLDRRRGHDADRTSRTAITWRSANGFGSQSRPLQANLTHEPSLEGLSGLETPGDGLREAGGAPESASGARADGQAARPSQGIRDRGVLKAMRSIPRERFVRGGAAREGLQPMRRCRSAKGNRRSRSPGSSPA